MVEYVAGTPVWVCPLIHFHFPLIHFQAHKNALEQQEGALREEVGVLKSAALHQDQALREQVRPPSLARAQGCLPSRV